MPGVLELYASRGDDILERTTFEMFKVLNSTLNGERPNFDGDYMKALRTVLYSSKPSVERELVKQGIGTPFGRPVEF